MTLLAGLGEEGSMVAGAAALSTLDVYLAKVPA